MMYAGMTGWINDWIGYTKVGRFFVAPGVGGAQLVAEDRTRVAILFDSVVGTSMNLEFDIDATTSSGLIHDFSGGPLLLTAEWFADVVGCRFHCKASAGAQITGWTFSQVRAFPMNALYAGGILRMPTLSERLSNASNNGQSPAIRNRSDNGAGLAGRQTAGRPDNLRDWSESRFAQLGRRRDRDEWGGYPGH